MEGVPSHSNRITGQNASAIASGSSTAIFPPSCLKQSSPNGTHDHWGFHISDEEWKSPRAVVKMLLTCANGKGNLLLNIGHGTLETRFTFISNPVNVNCLPG